jgi:RNA polymerase sigma factor (sigma-70 family)
MIAENSAVSVDSAFWANAFIDNFPKLCARAAKTLTRGDAAAAEDIVSETFTKVMRSKAKPEDIKHPFGYMWTAIRNAWLSQQRRKDVANTVLLEDLDATTKETGAFRLEPKIQQTLELRESLQRMRFRIGPMSLDEKEMVDMIAEGLTWSEIANEFEEDVNATQLRRRRVTSRLRYRLAPKID